MKAFKFSKILENAVNEIRAEHGCDEKVRVEPCEIVRICANGSLKEIGSGKFVRKSTIAKPAK